MQNYAKPKKSKFGKYLFCYFTGNEPERERICFALSDDGYNFTPINGGNPVIIQKKGTKCMRDPFILRNENGGYYIDVDIPAYGCLIISDAKKKQCR